MSSTPDLSCDIYEWPVEPLRGSTNFFAHAEFFTLRALAAKNVIVSCGLPAATEELIDLCPVSEGERLARFAGSLDWTS
ncbi:MAG: hypothetical protein WBV78_16195 [Roseobacter sp.]